MYSTNFPLIGFLFVFWLRKRYIFSGYGRNIRTDIEVGSNFMERNEDPHGFVLILYGSVIFHTELSYN